MIGRMYKVRPLSAGIIGALAIFFVYFAILSVVQSFEHAVQQTIDLWFFLFPLSAGFGVQIALYTYIKSSIDKKINSVQTEIMATGCVSTTSMIACCVHHIIDLLPVVGLSAATILLTQYQTAFMVLAIFSNLIGITMMLLIIKEHELVSPESMFKRLFSFDLKLLRNTVLVISLLGVSIAFLNAYANNSSITRLNTNTSVVSQGFSLKPLTNSENNVLIEVRPIAISFGSELEFEISMNTHEGSLDFELEKISILEDDKGNLYVPIGWNGSPLGGHHRNGILVFPPLKGKVNSIKLTLKDIYGVPERVFIWNLNA